MENSKELKRIYRIEVQGIEAATKKVEQLNQEINLQTQIKKEAQKILLTNPGDVVQIEKQSKVIAESEIAIKKLNAEKRIATKEADALIRAEEQIAIAEQKAIQTNQLAAGSYKALYEESRKLNQLYRETSPQNPLFEKIKADAIAAQQKVHDFNRTLSSEGTLVGEYSRGIINAFKSADMGDILRSQVAKGEAAIKQLDAALEQLKIEYNETKIAGGEGLANIEKELINNRQAALQLGTQVSSMKTEMKGAGTVGNQLTSELKTGFKGLSSDLTNTVVGFIGLQAAIGGVQNLTHGMAELSDQTTNLEIELDKTAGGANKLVDGLAKLNTRTKLAGLEEIANVATKAGVQEENLLSVTEAIDKVKVAFGKDFGDVEKGTEAITKIISIFEGKENLTGDNYLKVGNAIRTLANESVASVPYLNDFSQRLAGLEGIAKVGLPSTLGLASGFEQFGQSAETASTVLIKLIPKLASNTEQFAKYAGLTGNAFKQLIESDPSEALIKFSEGIVKNKSGLVELEEALKDSEIFGPKGGGKGAAILGVLGSKSEDFRKAILSAKDAIADTSSIEDAFNKKNENFASVLDKISKKFADLGNNKALQTLILGIATVFAFLLGNLQIGIPVFLTYIALTNTLAGSILRNIGAWILEKAALGIEIAQLAASNAIKATATFITAVYTAATIASITATGAAAIAYRVLAASIALLTSPIGIVTGLVIGLTTVFAAMTASASNNVRVTKELALTQAELAAQQRVNAEISERVVTATEDLISKIKQYTFIAGDASLSDKVRHEALSKLVEISPAYRDALDGETINTLKLTSASNLLIESLTKQARVKAVKDLFDQKTKEQFELENKIASSYSPVYASDGKTIVGKEVKNKDNSFIGAVKSLFSDNEVADLHKNEEKLKNVNLELEQLKKTIGENTDLQNEIANGDKKTDIKTPGDSSNTDKSKVAAVKKTAEQIRDERLKVLKDEEDTEKQLNEIKFKKGQETEIQYLENLNKITQDYADKKLAVVLKAAAQEKLRIGEFQLDKINSEKDTNEKIYKLKQDALSKELKLKTFVSDPKKSKEENAKAQIEVDEFNKAALIKFNNDALALENEYHIKSVENEKKWAKDIKDINEKLRQDNIDLDKAKLDDAKAVGEKQLAEFKAQIAARRLALTEAGKSTKGIDKEEELGTVARQLASLNVQMPIIKKLYEEGVISAKEYYDFLAEHDKLAAQNFENITARIGKSFNERLKGYKTAGDFIKGELQNLLTPKNKDGSDKEEYGWIGEAISQSFDIGKQAMNDYFDSKKQRIEEEKNYELDKLTIEKEQRLSRAQSQAEEQSINRQYDKEKAQIEQKAFEQTKKIKKSEAKIAFATELANIWSSVWQLGPIAGPIAGVVFSALAAVRYAMNVNNINSEKFGQGGWVKTGGIIHGPSHADGGVPLNTAEAEGGELSIINKRAANSTQVYNVTGTTKQIASAINEAGGGRRFAIGGKLDKLEYGGSFGRQLSIPGDVSYLRDNGAKEMIEATNRRIDNIKVFVVSKEVEKQNNKLNKAAQVGTL